MNSEDDQKDKADIRFAAVVAVVSGALYIFLPSIIGKVIALFLLAAFGWQVAYEGATILSARLTEPHHRTYQIAAAFVAPLILSLVFVFSSDTLDASAFFFGGWSLYDLSIAGILFFFGWVGGDQLNPKHPFRAYWVAATIMFVLNLMGHTGVTGIDEYNGEGTRLAVDSKQASAAAETGYYFFHYLYQVAIVYSGMFAHRIRENFWTWKRHRIDVPKVPEDAHELEKVLRALIDHSVNGIIRFRWGEDEDGENVLVSIFANTAAGRFLGSDADDLVDRVAPELIRLATSGMDSEAADDIVRRFEIAISRGDSLDIEVHRVNRGEDRWLRMICEPVGDDFAATFVDISDRKVKEKKMESIAFSDPVTGALNRRGFERAAAKRLATSDDDATGALLFIDLNDFKEVDDRYGHEIGDQLLRVAAERVRESLRSHDIIGHRRDYQFLALVPDVKADTAHKLAAGLAQGLEEPYVIGDKTLHCAASIGLALYPDNANTLTGLLREAHALRRC